MTPNPFERPGNSEPSKSATARPNPVPQKPIASQQKKVIPPVPPRGGGGGSGGGSGGGGGGGGGELSPWLYPDREPSPDKTASFVEYLRWMRSPDSLYKDPKKVQILQMAEEEANNYGDRLTKLTERTKLLAGEGNYFFAHCPWRLRIGGHRGPESILLPAFDALGMPYIPSSTLRGVARNQAIQEFTQDYIDELKKQGQKIEDKHWKEARKQAERPVERYFGSLEAKKADRAGKVVFFDAYPLPKSGGLAMDMVNNIWTWDGNLPKYNPKPNLFFSLKEATFLIGLRLASSCDDTKVLPRVKEWLIKGLQAGIGSQVNTGYGEILIPGEDRPTNVFFRIDFSLEGQLIHGCQKFLNVNQAYRKDRNGSWVSNAKGKAEVRPVAFKSMLRYWFRAFSLGVLPLNYVQRLEALLFGGINPHRKLGWLKFQTIETIQPESTRKSNANKLKGEFLLSFSSSLPISQQNNVTHLMRSLIWILFHLGGIGQGARRPCYSRSDNPYLRGSTLIADENTDDWKLPENLQQFQEKFRTNLLNFYQALNELQALYGSDEPLNQIKIEANSPKNINPISEHQWVEAVDKNCKIFVVRGKDGETKPYALDLLHKQFHRLESEGEMIEAKSLCGGVKKDVCTVNEQEVNRDVSPSPVWIADLGSYQIVTIFGATYNPRKEYWERLTKEADCWAQLWPLT